jgi:hypothetical protein
MRIVELRTQDSQLIRVIATAHELLTVDQPALAKGEAADRTDTR